MEGRVTIDLSEYEKLKELARPHVNFWDSKFVCPYCKHINNWRNHNFKLGTNLQFTYCDSEAGGCDKQIILESVVDTKLILKSHKIPETTNDQPEQKKA